MIPKSAVSYRTDLSMKRIKSILMRQKNNFYCSSEQKVLGLVEVINCRIIKNRNNN